KTAYNYLKTAYQMGGSSPRGFDCSGFTRFIFAKHGIELPRSSVEQAQRGKAINKEELRTGDLVFFSTFRRGISHVGIFIANGLFIHSAGRGKGVSLDNMLAGYWQQRYRAARRVDLSGARQYAKLDSEVLANAG
ncbi:MAG: C40 family peptidase, partial [SAR324 cluster bacterium]|nr:C40 family peptidase [SAR324 cluster bacterium]